MRKVAKSSPPTIEDYHTALLQLADALELDVNGVQGMPLSGNGGLVSENTLKVRCDAIRLIYSGRRHYGLS